MAYRGPDRTSRYNGESCSLHVSEFRITGPGSTQQPQTSSDGRVTVVFNGEIYNYRELNELLESEGRPVRSESDTETLLGMLEVYGVEAFERMEGMWALAAVFHEGQRLVLGRDRFGEKPLFFLQRGGLLHFSSESSFLVPFSDGTVSDRGIAEYLGFGFSQDHLVSGIRRCRPGTFVVVDRGEPPVERRYWNPVFDPDESLTAENAADRALEILEPTVRALVPPDVGFGSYISGGVDSAVITSLLPSADPFPLFTSGLVGLDSPEDELPVDDDYAYVEDAGNEFEYADELATRFTGRYERAEFTVDDLIQALPRMVAHLPGGPVVSTSFPLFHFSAVRSRGTRVAFTGEGSDELHGGYATSQPGLYGDSLAGSFVRLSNYFTDAQRKRLLGERRHSALTDSVRQIDSEVEREFAGTGTGEDQAFNRIRHFMLRYVFGPHLLEKADGMTMGFAPTELRMPFLAAPYRQFALRLPLRVCVHGDRRKYFVHELAKRIDVPGSIINRPRKQRTSLPYYRLFYGDRRFREFARGIFGKDARVRDLLELPDPLGFVADLQGTPDAHKRAWSLLILELWLREMGL